MQAPPLHSPLTRWSTNGNRDQLSQHYNPCQNLVPRCRAFKTYSLWRGFSFQPTRRPNSVDMDSNTTEGEPVAEGLPEAANAIGDSRQNDRDGSTLTTANSSRVISSRRSIPGKIWMPTNQIKSTSACAHASRELRTRALQASLGI